jgi:cytidylate kinase
MTVITIRGQLGSGAPQIGTLCANTLNLEYMDREIINRIAERLERPRQQIIAKEILPVTLKERIARIIKDDFPGSGSISHASPDEDVPPLDNAHYMKGLKSVIRGLARSESVVINGRGSQFFLKNYPGALHVLTIASLELRIKRVMKSLNLNEEAAKEKIERYDGNRREFIKKYFKADLENPMHYDMVINTEHISYESAVSLIVKAVSLRDRAMSNI